MSKQLEGDSFVLSSLPVSRVHGDLWMGGLPPIGPSVSENFDCLVLAAMEYQTPWDYPGVEVIAVPLNDDGNPMPRKEMADAVQAAGKVIRWLEEGKSVLVTCRMGKNRSGLITALALCFGPSRMKPQDAVATIRAARGPGALTNKHFLIFLLEFYTSKTSSASKSIESKATRAAARRRAPRSHTPSNS